jgi:acyl-phosphate glycerol 3-phosphate acyltransferase
MVLLAVTAAAYLVGAIPFGYLIARGQGVDILHAGSGNIGATNVGRVLGRRWGILVFLLDFAKGALPVLAAHVVPEETGWLPDVFPVCAGVAAFLGHLYPVYLRFRGGKGVATGAGVAAMLAPGPMLLALLAWLTVVAATRTISLASITAAVVLCLQRLLATPGPWDRSHLVVTLFCLLAAGLVVVRHHGNLRRLWRGTENQLKDTPAMLQLSKTLHVVALGLCFGAQVWFAVTAFQLFGGFGILARDPPHLRPLWLPVPPQMEREAPSPAFPDPLRKEQGSRLAGFAVGQLFPVYYALQTVCVLVALVVCWSWPGQRVHHVRRAVLVAAVVLLGIGWWLERKVTTLRGPRDELTDKVLLSAHPSEVEIKEAEQARSAFGMWHGINQLQDLLTIVLVGLALVLAAQLPAAAPAGSVQAAGRPPEREAFPVNT